MPDESPAPRAGLTAVVVVAVAASALLLYILQDLLVPLLLAALFAAATRPIYLRIRKTLRRDTPAALATLLLLTLLVIVPLALIAYNAWLQAMEMTAALDLAVFTAGLERLIREVFGGGTLALAGHQFALPAPAVLASEGENALRSLPGHLFTGGAAVLKGVAGAVTGGFIILFCMYYLYLDGPALARRLLRLSPLREEAGHLFLDRFLASARAGLLGILGIGLLQGTVAFFAFLLAGLSSPLFLAMLVGLSSAVPVVGSGLVFLPAAAVLFFQGHTGWAVFLLVALVVTGALDNLVRPRLVGGKLGVHDLLIFLATLGGLGLFGLAGFFLGPLAAALAVTAWEVYEETLGERCEGPG